MNPSSGRGASADLLDESELCISTNTQAIKNAQLDYRFIWDEKGQQREQNAWKSTMYIQTCRRDLKVALNWRVLVKLNSL